MEPANGRPETSGNRRITGGACGINAANGSYYKYWWNLPGSRHNKGNTFSFADCHVEHWQWHGTAVLTYTGPSQAGDNSDDLPRTEAGTVRAFSPPCAGRLPVIKLTI
jgi:prepilin-type processing-associated H-X9-DG protein